MPDQTYLQQALVPNPCQGVNVNFCKNPHCRNFGVPAPVELRRRRRVSAISSARFPVNAPGPVPLPIAADVAPAPPQETADQPLEYIPASAGSGYPYVQCVRCQRRFPVKSNLGVFEELTRVSSYLKEKVVSCPDESCDNHGVDVKMGTEFYRRFGKTKSGSNRYLCKACGKTFSIGKSTCGQKKTHVNIMVFRLLMNKVPFRRICEVAGIGPGTLYSKIQFLFEQCQAFVANREQKLVDGTVRLGKRYISVDRQDYMVNWSKASDRRNVILKALGAADNKTGYVFGMHLNYDGDLDSRDIENRALRCGDYDTSPPFRRYSQYWLARDYAQAADRSSAAGRQPRRPRGYLVEEITAEYQTEATRPNEDSAEEMSGDVRRPEEGMQVHDEYTLYGSFLLLRQMLQHSPRVCFFLDQDAGMQNACLTAFADEILAYTCDAFFVRIKKGMTQPERLRALADAQRELDAFSQQCPYTGYHLKIAFIKQRMQEMVTIGRDKWLMYPIPNAAEPEKMVCHLTDIQNYDADHKAKLYYRASLHAIDRFFMQVRRRISLLERPIQTAASGRRTWFGYSPYNPEYIHKLLCIFRVFYNYVETGEDKQTPAMRLGLARAPIRMEDIIYYRG